MEAREQDRARFVEVRLRPTPREPYAVRIGPGAPMALAASLHDHPIYDLRLLMAGSFATTWMK